jgi:redox-sensitive bicupin YhaK (pirin superfamily)
MADDTAIELVIDPRQRPVGRSTVQRLLPYAKRRMVGPFIFIDRMGPETIAAGEATSIAAHPHIGLSTLTFLFEGQMVHRDSTGAEQTITPGDVNWMTAGAGVTHSERSLPADVATTRRLHGLQLWVALPTELEESAPFFAHVAGSELPADRIGGTSVRILAGTGWAATSPVPVSSPMLLAEVTLAESTITIDDHHPERALLALDGDMRIDGSAVRRGQLAVLAPGTTPTLDGTGRVMIFGGDPVGPRHIWWNFVSSDQDRIEDAKQQWADQRFPKVVGDHDEWVPLPG